MSSDNRPLSGIDQATRKFLLSAFVVVTFIAYAVHEHFTNPNNNLGSDSPSSGSAATQSPTTADQATSTSAPGLAAAVTPQSVDAPAQPIPTPSPAPTTVSQGQYKDGSYVGTEIDAFYGLVKVDATIKNGKITDVQFLEYPNDRRTSVRINSVAMPWLQQEAIQAQNANVNMISGATLTSEAFIMSLQSALKNAQN